MLITFEGIDGSGKTTQLQLLKEFLANLGYEVLVLREPGGVILSEKIREILLNSDEDINPITELLLFESSRSHLVHSVIQPALAQGKIIICDRFYDSTTAYQGYGRGLDIATIHKFNKIATLGVSPDITFYLDIELEEAKIRSERKIYDRIESSGDDFYLRVINGFRELSKKYPKRIYEIDASNQIDLTFEKIKNIILKRLKSKKNLTCNKIGTTPAKALAISNPF